MAYFRIFSASLCLSLASLVCGEPPVQGYHYRPNGHQSNGFNRPSTTYLPPKTGIALPSSYLPPNSFTGPGQYDNGNSHHHSHNHHHGNENEVPKSYEFGYSVKDAQSGNDYDRREMSDGNVVRGEYRVQLPDGRLQIVTYHADWRTGYHANVRYEGEARYPENNNQGYSYNAPQFTGSLNGFNNPGSSYKPSTAYGPPGYQ
ncbi:pro-resilin-like [Maniola jurtina]|uniref:pro-resilin-like n=1 Tax=Maniola jurtina TaxID=191418 RepID=UPI001E68BE17|nr:pro-resilin-like [Maniola jurtina]